jgi:hypothetical protein
MSGCGPLLWADEFDGPAGAPPDPRTWQPEAGGRGDHGIGGELGTGAPLADGFHAYAVHWEPDRIRWFFDGILYHVRVYAA